MGVGAPLKTHQTTYSYDQLNRIKSMDGAYPSAVAGIYGSSPSGYASTYSFDENGNLQTLQRYASDGENSILMDDFEYIYEDPSSNNRLNWVRDYAGLSVFGDVDIDETMTNDNYLYDEIGQLVQDNDEGIANIKWKVTNKVEHIEFTDGKIIHFDYDPMGNRIAKHVQSEVIDPESNNIMEEISSTFYILDENKRSLRRRGLNGKFNKPRYKGIQ